MSLALKNDRNWDKNKWGGNNCRPENLGAELPSGKWLMRSTPICAVVPLEGLGLKPLKGPEGRDEKYGWK